jgi:hypothetical protein
MNFNYMLKLLWKNRCFHTLSVYSSLNINYINSFGYHYVLTHTVIMSSSLKFFINKFFLQCSFSYEIFNQLRLL